jgi:RNA recognition motif-containing protein
LFIPYSEDGGGRNPPRDENAPRSSTRIHLSNLAFSTTEQDLMKEFEQYGVKEAVIIRSRFDQRFVLCVAF